MKLSPLLSQFLLTNKQLHLAGIGTFLLDDSGTINFQQDITTKEDSELVKYLAEQSGKMKSLMAADLDSHLELARQFLNIGKPYLFEGIGTLSKNKFGNFEFIQSSAQPEKKDSQDSRDVTSTTENSFTDYEEMFSPKKTRTPASKRFVTWLIVIAGLSLAVFGGYLVYTKTKNKKDPVLSEKEEIKAVPVTDSLPTKLDSVQQNVPTSKMKDSTSLYRFVIEKANKQRALYRYSNLIKNFINVQMETKDSVSFKLYFLLPSAPSDTAHKRDSLQRLYGTRGKTTIELN